MKIDETMTKLCKLPLHLFIQNNCFVKMGNFYNNITLFYMYLIKKRFILRLYFYFINYYINGDLPFFTALCNKIYSL